MNKLFGLFLLAIAFAPSAPAEAASRFLTCTATCTITAVDTSIWGAASGGTGASVPGSGDDVILDAATCVGGVTCTATFGAGYAPTWQTVTMTLCTASTAGCILEANTNANTITLLGNNSLVNAGSGTRTISGGTWVLSAAQAFWSVSATGTITNSPSVSFTGTATQQRRFAGGGKTYGTVTVNASASWPFVISNANTIATFTVTAPNKVYFTNATTHTITTFTNIGASFANPVLLSTDAIINGVATVSLTNNFTCDFCGLLGITGAGAGSFSATNSISYGQNAGTVSISNPSSSSGGRIIGG